MLKSRNLFCPHFTVAMVAVVMVSNLLHPAIRQMYDCMKSELQIPAGHPVEWRIPRVHSNMCHLHKIFKQSGPSVLCCVTLPPCAALMPFESKISLFVDGSASLCQIAFVMPPSSSTTYSLSCIQISATTLSAAVVCAMNHELPPAATRF